VTELLTPPLAVAALVLCAAGLAKLRAPDTAVTAARTVGLPAGASSVRAFAVLELALGVVCIVSPSRAAAAVLAAVFAGFVPLSLPFARRHTPCGCFGERELPASVWQSVLSGLLALIGVAAALAGAHGTGWLLGRGALSACALAVGVAGAAFATVLAYTELPLAWSAWSGGPR
jgi:hypothetical protein